MKWESIHEDRTGGTYIDRFPVPGGWLYRTRTVVWVEPLYESSQKTLSVSTAFVPQKESPDA